ncbi:helix-turn-helix domain-containing protein [uncultured Ilyobacter sp.]|uniref:helix-turn-helix domain-containing protein n=1 Tax=uncultured Ilyobacter sp. TaxID=544433 RepID=UPI0029F4CF20|nr:helix-turn-helix domain-containing protein [uncultured Ilyobacter sp.]
MSHTYFTINERETIALSLAKGMKPFHIAKILDRNRSSIGREIKQNSIDGEYRGLNAQEAYNSRKSSCGCGAKEKLEDEKIVEYIQKRLEDGWTPEEIKLKVLTVLLLRLSTEVLKRGNLKEQKRNSFRDRVKKI